MDAISLERIKTLHPLLRDEARQILEECDRVLTGRAKVIFTHTQRTFKEQDDLYALGRTKVNPDGKSASRPMGFKVTNAKGGSSIHNYAMAIDIVLIIDGKTASWSDTIDYDGDKIADWMEVVAVFKRFGWAWGGDWSSFIDKPHFEKTFGYTTSQLRSMYNTKKFLSGTTYIDLGKTLGNNKRVTANLRLRECVGATDDNKILLTIPIGSMVQELKKYGDWSEVQYGSHKGFVSNTYLS